VRRADTRAIEAITRMRNEARNPLHQLANRRTRAILNLGGNPEAELEEFL
jgi:hypothetical protein